MIHHNIVRDDLSLVVLESRGPDGSDIWCRTEIERRWLRRMTSAQRRDWWRFARSHHEQLITRFVAVR